MSMPSSSSSKLDHLFSRTNNSKCGSSGSYKSVNGNSSRCLLSQLDSINSDIIGVTTGTGGSGDSGDENCSGETDQEDLIENDLLLSNTCIKIESSPSNSNHSLIDNNNNNDDNEITISGRTEVIIGHHQHQLILDRSRSNSIIDNCDDDIDTVDENNDVTAPYELYNDNRLISNNENNDEESSRSSTSSLASSSTSVSSSSSSSATTTTTSSKSRTSNKITIPALLPLPLPPPSTVVIANTHIFDNQTRKRKKLIKKFTKIDKKLF